MGSITASPSSLRPRSFQAYRAIGEWGLFDAGFREAANNPVEQVHGKLLRILHREQDGEWKFSRVMVVWSTKSER
jgi:hypothetical protein